MNGIGSAEFDSKHKAPFAKTAVHIIGVMITFILPTGMSGSAGCESMGKPGIVGGLRFIMLFGGTSGSMVDDLP